MTPQTKAKVEAAAKENPIIKGWASEGDCAESSDMKKVFLAGAEFRDGLEDWISVDIAPDFKPLKVGEKDAQTENLLLTDGISVTIGFCTRYFLAHNKDWQAYGNPEFEPTHYKRYLPLPSPPKK